MLPFPILLFLFMHIWVAKSLIIECSSTNCNKQFIYDKTYTANVQFKCDSDVACTSLVVYWAAPKELTIVCQNKDGCNNIQIYCGIWDPPGDQYTLTDMNVASNVVCEIKCDRDTDINLLPSCVDTYLGCKGDTIDNFYCYLNGFNDNQIVRATLECDMGNSPNRKCNAHCDEGCSDSSLLCHSASECTKSGVGITKFTGITYNPTQSPTLSPTSTTATPTNKPSTSPTKNPSFVPTSSTPTTTSPTTRQPTTSIPTTNIPTTNTPTSAIPTTSQPTTDIPTTTAPTQQPTTIIPTTNEPTNLPTTSIPTTTDPTSVPTTHNPTINIFVSTENDAGQVNDITTSMSDHTGTGSGSGSGSHKDASGAGMMDLDKIITYLVVVIGVLLVVCVCMVVIYRCQKRRMRMRQDIAHIAKVHTDNRVDTNMVKVKSLSVEMIHVATNVHMNGHDEVSPASVSGKYMDTLGGTAGGDEDQMINTIMNSVQTKKDSVNFVDNDEDDDEFEDLYKNDHKNIAGVNVTKGVTTKGVTTKGWNNDDDDSSDTPLEPMDMVATNARNVLTDMGGM